MKNPSNARRARGQRGIAAVEMAIILPLLILLLTIPIFFARYFWFYTASQKAASDAARYMSTVRRAELRSPALVTHATDVARDIVSAQLSDLGLDGTESVEVFCDSGKCLGNGSIPETVRVRINIMPYTDNIFQVVSTGDYGLTITADVEVRYAGI